MAPCWSITLPRMSPVPCCASRGDADNNTPRGTATNHFHALIQPPLADRRVRQTEIGNSAQRGQVRGVCRTADRAGETRTPTASLPPPDRFVRSGPTTDWHPVPAALG